MGPTVTLDTLKIPPTVQDILASRIDRLPAADKEVLQTLAVIGMEFPLALAREVTRNPDDELNRILSDLELAEFIYEQPALGDIECKQGSGARNRPAPLLFSHRTRRRRYPHRGERRGEV